MTAVRFYVDAAGYVVGGVCDHPSFSGKFDLAHIPIKTLEEGGVAVVWPGGVPWTNSHFDNLVHPNETERAA